MKKLFTILASISLLIIALSLAYYLVIFLPNKEKTKQETSEARLENCQNLILEIDQLLVELDEDYDIFIQAIADWDAYDISYAKLAEQVEDLAENRERRTFRYEMAIDKYNDKCFELFK